MAHQSYDELEWHLRRLRAAYAAGKLIFVLGAGINRDFGFPDWGELLVKLVRRCGRLQHPAHATVSSGEVRQIMEAVIADPLLQAASVRGAYVSKADWSAALREALNIRPRGLNDERSSLRRIARSVANQYLKDPRRHVAILTFNFDDLIERALAFELGRAANDVVTSVATANDLAGASHRPGIYVYHLHGSLSNLDSVILDAMSYVRILAAPANHWSWSCMNTFLFQEHSGVMFVGLSLLDPSLRLLLTHAATNGMPLSAIFVGKPMEPPILTDDVDKSLNLAFMMRDIQSLFDDLLEELSLIPYHVTAWSEIGELLDKVMEDG